MDCDPRPRHHKMNPQKTLIILTALLGGVNCIFTINVTQSTSPLTIKFDACVVLPCGNLNSQRQLQGEGIYMCPHPSLTDPVFSGPCQHWIDVWWTTQYNGWTAPAAKGSALPNKIHIIRGTPPPNCKNLQCNPLLLVIDNPQTMSQEPSILRGYALGADVTGRDPIGTFRLNLTASQTPTNIPTPTPSPSAGAPAQDPDQTRGKGFTPNHRN